MKVSISIRAGTLTYTRALNELYIPICDQKKK